MLDAGDPYLEARYQQMPLSDTGLKNLKPTEKPYKKADGGGLHVLVSPTGAKLFRLAYRYNGKQKLLSLGAYPAVKLVEVRAKRDEARALLAKGLDPSAERKRAEVEKAVETLTTFRAVAEEWLAKREKERAAEQTMVKARWLLGKALPALGNREIAELEPTDLLAVLRVLEDQAIYESANRLRAVFSRVFRYAIATGRAKRDPSVDLRGALVVAKPTHRAALFDPKEIGGLLRAIRGYSGQHATRGALLIAAYTFVRPGEVRFARWTEIDADLWTIPAERMKIKRKHIVPLSRQAREVFDWLRPITGRSDYVFPALRTANRPISENTTNAALRRMGYTVDDMTTQGFRRIASTMLNEQGWNSDWIERQLAHVEGNKVRGAYNAAEYLPGRTEMMQAWADYLDALERGK